jgi:hypothetical protein
MTFAAGQQWTYRAPPEVSTSRIVIGAIVEFEGGHTVVCCAVTGAMQRHSDGSLDRVVVPFLPMTLEALEQTVAERDGDGVLPDEFAMHFQAWRDDPRGASYFTVPFEGSVERMIGLQMAAIVEQP